MIDKSKIIAELKDCNIQAVLRSLVINIVYVQQEI